MGNSFLDIKLIRSPERLEFRQVCVCVLSLYPHRSNRLGRRRGDGMMVRIAPGTTGGMGCSERLWGVVTDGWY